MIYYLTYLVLIVDGVGLALLDALFLTVCANTLQVLLNAGRQGRQPAEFWRRQGLTLLAGSLALLGPPLSAAAILAPANPQRGSLALVLGWIFACAPWPLVYFSLLMPWMLGYRGMIQYVSRYLLALLLIVLGALAAQETATLAQGTPTYQVNCDDPSRPAGLVLHPGETVEAIVSGLACYAEVADQAILPLRPGGLLPVGAPDRYMAARAGQTRLVVHCPNLEPGGLDFVCPIAITVQTH